MKNIKATLKGTNNKAFAHLINQTGDLFVSEGKFYFQFLNEKTGEFQTLTSSILGCMGSLINPSFREVTFQTRNSMYVFEKII